MSKRISRELEDEAVLEALLQERLPNQIASHYEVHPIMLSAWKPCAQVRVTYVKIIAVGLTADELRGAQV